jgi:hypothetical protein
MKHWTLILSGSGSFRNWGNMMVVRDYMTPTEQHLFQLSMDAMEDALANVKRILERVRERIEEEVDPT